MKSCIDLKERFGRRYRIQYEETYQAESSKAERPWLVIIPCRFGHIYPCGGDLLAASIDGHPNVAATLRRLPCCRVVQDGDCGEMTAVFDVADFAKVAKIIRPRRRRQLSDAQRAELLARLQTASMTR